VACVGRPEGDERPLTHAAVLVGAFLFNLGQGVLRPTMPLYLQTVFAANYRMVTWIPTVFGAGKWIANLPTGYLEARLGRRPLMAAGLTLIACCDVASVVAPTYLAFLGLRALAGVGWAMFATVATTTMVAGPAARRRGRAVSVLLMSETSGLLAGSAAGGWLYRDLGATSPLLFEAGCMLVAALAVTGAPSPPISGAAGSRALPDRGMLGEILRTPGVVLMSLTNALLVAIQTGVLVFLYPLYLVNRAGMGPGTVGVLISLTVLGRLLTLWFGGGASDRWGRLRVLVPGLLAYAALLATVTSVTHPVWLGLWSVAIGAASGFVAALPTALVGDRVQGPHQGVAIGWLRTMADSGQIVGPLVMGALADAVDLSAPFVAAAALLVIAAWHCHRAARVETAA
jgi:DHA1 family multidrug resistance protein-like MFS transporter